MDFIAEQTYDDRSSTTTPKPSDTEASTTPTRSSDTAQPQRETLQTEFQETFKAFQSSPWGTKLGGWWSTARTQGASYYETARKEAEKREAEAAKVLEDARKVVVERTKTVVEAAENQLDNIVNEEKRAEIERERQEKEAQEAQTREESTSGEKEPGDGEDEDTETFLNRFKTEAAKRLKEVQKAEDAADEALLRFGSNIRNFLKDTISITAPEASSNARSSEVLFESKDAATGKRVIHASRFDAQLHVIHTTSSSFTQDPDTDGSDGQWETFKTTFDIEKQTERIAADLEKYPDLRNTMERLVPENVDYKDFWARYYFLRHVVEVREEKRRELLKASAADQEEEVAWDEDSDAEETTEEQKEQIRNLDAGATTPSQPQPEPQSSTSTHARTDSDAMTLRPPRRSHDEKSVADSEASYDLVSGAASHANSSPKEKPIKEESDDDDWE